MHQSLSFVYADAGDDWIDEDGIVDVSSATEPIVVAEDHMAEFARDGGMDAASMAQVSAVLDQAQPLIEAGRRDPAVAARLRGLAEAITPPGSDQTAKRQAALKETLTGIAARIG